MKTRILVFTFVTIGFSFFLDAQDKVSNLIRPSERTSATVEESERNPFAKVEEPKPALLEEPADSRSEESQIESIIKDMSVSGRTHGASGWKVLLGDMILEEGKELPPLINGQTVVLKVASISESIIEIIWISKEQGSIPKRTFVQIDLTPSVKTIRRGSGSAEKKARSSVSITPPKN